MNEGEVYFVFAPRVHGKLHTDNLSQEEAYEVCIEGVLLADTFFTVLRLLSQQRLDEWDGASLAMFFENIGEMGTSITSTVLSTLDKLKREFEQEASDEKK